MALKLADRVQETTTTSGTGPISLGGAVLGYQTFVAGIGSGNSCYYTISDVIAGAWEVGIGTVTAGTPNTLARTTVLSSSNSGALVNFAGNTSLVWCDYPAEKAVYQDASNNVTIAGNIYTTGGSIIDSLDNVRNIPIAAKTAAYTLLATDTGKAITITTGGITVPANVMSANNVVSIYNNSGSAQTITQGSSLTLQWAGQTASTTGNRTLGLYGLCTVLFLSATSAVISGVGLT